jgi:7-keto-8-aminopelargonate synthetase-like enzyme
MARGLAEAGAEVILNARDPVALEEQAARLRFFVSAEHEDADIDAAADALVAAADSVPAVADAG